MAYREKFLAAQISAAAVSGKLNISQSMAGSLALTGRASDIPIHYGTCEYWNSQRELVGKKSHIYVYSDFGETEIDGKIVAVPNIKIGDGNAYLIDNPFLTASVEELLKMHIADDTQVTVDSALSSTSTNPVQNKVVNSALAGKAASSHTHSDYALKSKYGDTTIDVGRKADTNVGEYSTAEGRDTTASGNYSHAEGYVTTASKNCSHAEGNNTTASGNYSHAEGINTIASGRASHAGGVNTKALHNYEVAYGSYNISNEDTLFSIGDGTTDDARHNAFEITTTGGKLHDKDIATTDLAGSSKSGLMSADHFNFLEKYKKIRGSSASYTFTSMQDYITVNNCYGNCNNGLVVLSGWFTSTGSAGNPAIISGSFPSAASSFVCGIIVNMDSPNTNTRLLVRHESDGTSSLQCGGNLTAGKYFFIGVYTAERCAYNLPYTL